MRLKYYLVLIILLSLPLSVFSSVVFPFTTQAPVGNWADAKQQDGCEEASVIMALAWAKNEQLPVGRQAEKLITKLADWEKKTTGNYHDASASTTAKLIVDQYFGYKNYEFVKGISLANMKKALLDGKVLIVPMNGKMLRNPYFSRGGPDRHMLLLVGYDKQRGEFVTNDPGTRRGQGFRYKEQLFYDAIRDYPTGNHTPLKNLGRNVIIISKQKGL